jgi:hypothetical protein
MGWSTSTLPWGTSLTEELKRIHTWESNTHSSRVIMSSLVKYHTWYAAVERTDKASNTLEVYAVICLVKYNKSRGEYSYHSMHEAEGPSAQECPHKILKLLTPTTHPHAINWRLNCLYTINARKAKQPLKTGYHLIFEEDIPFQNGDHVNVFYIENAKGRFYRHQGKYYSIRSYIFRDVPYKVVKLEGVPKEDLPTLIGISPAVDKEIYKRLQTQE